MTFDEWFQSKQGECYDSMYVFARDAWNAAVVAEREACIDACMTASPDHEMRKAIGDAAHYAACANAIKARSNA